MKGIERETVKDMGRKRVGGVEEQKGEKGWSWWSLVEWGRR